MYDLPRIPQKRGVERKEEEMEEISRYIGDGFARVIVSSTHRVRIRASRYSFSRPVLPIGAFLVPPFYEHFQRDKTRVRARVRCNVYFPPSLIKIPPGEGRVAALISSGAVGTASLKMRKGFGELYGRSLFAEPAGSR